MADVQAASTAVHASEARRRKLLARGQDRLAKITNSISVESATVHANGTVARPAAGRSPSPPQDSSTSLRGDTPSPPSTTTDTAARQSYGTSAAERTWEQATPSSHPPASSPPHVLARQQQLVLTPSRRVHAALELLRPAQLLLAFAVALLVVLQGVLQGLVGQLARQRLSNFGLGVGIPMLPTAVPPLLQLMMLQGLLLAAGVPLLQQLPHRIRRQALAIDARSIDPRQRLLRMLGALFPSLQETFGVLRMLTAAVRGLSDSAAVFLVAAALLQCAAQRMLVP